MRPLRIALVHPFSWPEVRRGGERYLADLAWYLARAGHRVEVITGGSTAGADGARVRRVRAIASPRLERRGLTPVETFGLAALPALLRRRYDVVHALTPTGAIAARLAGRRTLYTVLGHPAPELVAAQAPLHRRLTARAVRVATVVAALSQASAGAVREVFGREAVVLSPGVRLEGFPAQLEPRAGPPRILFPVFASNPHKGLATLLGALGILLETFPDARLQLAGPGDPGWALRDAPEAVRRAVDAAGVGELTDLPRRYREATVTALPSLYEAFGLVLVESLASGTPVVCASTSGGAAEIVAGADVGRAVPYGDAAALAAALRETIHLARDPAGPRRCVEHARVWGWDEAIGPEHERIYRGIAARGSRATAEARVAP